MPEETFEISLDGVEGWKVGGLVLAPGTHICACVEEEVQLPGHDENSSDHPVVKLQWEAIAGEEQGGEVRDWMHVTQAALPRVVQLYEATAIEFPEGTFKWIPVKGKKAKVVVRREPRKDDPSKTRTVVKGYLLLSDTDRVAAEFGATEVGAGGDPGPEEERPPF